MFKTYKVIMESIASIISALNNNSFALVLIFCIILVLVFGIRKGSISFKGKGLEIGIQATERRIIQRQTTYIHGRLDAIASELIHDHPDFDEYRTRWICKCAELECIRSIHYNHIEDTDGYREDRFIALRDLVQKKADNEYFFSDDFEDYLKQFIAEMVKQLVRIRKNGK